MTTTKVAKREIEFKQTSDVMAQKGQTSSLRLSEIREIISSGRTIKKAELHRQLSRMGLVEVGKKRGNIIYLNPDNGIRMGVHSVPGLECNTNYIKNILRSFRIRLSEEDETEDAKDNKTLDVQVVKIEVKKKADRLHGGRKSLFYALLERRRLG